MFPPVFNQQTEPGVSFTILSKGDACFTQTNDENYDEIQIYMHTNIQCSYLPIYQYIHVHISYAHPFMPRPCVPPTTRTSFPNCFSWSAISDAAHKSLTQAESSLILSKVSAASSTSDGRLRNAHCTASTELPSSCSTAPWLTAEVAVSAATAS